MTTRFSPAYLLLLLLTLALGFTACDDDDLGTDDLQEQFSELRLDGDNFTGPVLEAGQHRFGVRFTEEDLRRFDGDELVGFRIFIGEAPAAMTLIVYDNGVNSPRSELDIINAGVNGVNSPGFYDYEFARPLIIDDAQPLWLVAEVELDRRQQSIGCDAPGSGVPGGDWLWSEDEWLPFSQRIPGEDVNWNIRGIVREL